MNGWIIKSTANTGGSGKDFRGREVSVIRIVKHRFEQNNNTHEGFEKRHQKIYKIKNDPRLATLGKFTAAVWKRRFSGQRILKKQGIKITDGILERMRRERGLRKG